MNEAKDVAKKLLKEIIAIRNEIDRGNMDGKTVNQHITLHVAKTLSFSLEVDGNKDRLISSAYQLDHRAYVEDVVSMLNEETIIDVDSILDLCHRLYVERYRIACGEVSSSVLSAWLYQDNMPKHFVPEDTKPHKFVKRVSEFERFNGVTKCTR